MKKVYRRTLLWCWPLLGARTAQAQTKDLEAKFAARLESASARLESIAKAMK